MLRRIILFFIIITAMGFFVFSNHRIEAENLKTFSRQGFLMDTVVQISINIGENSELISSADKILDTAFNILTSIDSLLSMYNPESEISKVNSKSGIAPLKVNSMTFEAVSEAKKYHTLTKGVFNPLIGSVTKLWKIGQKNKDASFDRAPSKSELDNAIKLSDINNLELLDSDSKEIFLKSKGSVIDLSGIAKGFASQKISEYLLKSGISSALINLGGNIQVIGKNKRNQNWVIGIRNPLSPSGKTAMILNVTDCAVITSGNYERYRTINGKKYSHFFDPSSGQSVNSDLLSVTLISEDGTLADALATSFMIMGFEKSKEIIEKTGAKAIFIQNTNDGARIYVNESLKNIIKESEFPVIYY